MSNPFDERPARSESTALYRRDLAHVHHHHFGQTAEAAATELLRRLRDRDVSAGTVVDLACGSGILSRRALEAGFDVVGVDLSPHMLRLASRHAVGAHLVRESLWTAELPPGVAVAAVGEAFNYATEELVPDLSRLETRLAAVARALQPGGLLLFDVAGPGRSGPEGSRQRVWEDAGIRLRLSETEDAAAGRLTRSVETSVPEGESLRRSRETHRLVLFPPEEVTASLHRAGFSVERRETYGPPMDPRPGWHVFVAEKLRP